MVTSTQVLVPCELNCLSLSYHHVENPPNIARVAFRQSTWNKVYSHLPTTHHRHGTTSRQQRHHDTTVCGHNIALLRRDAPPSAFLVLHIPRAYAVWSIMAATIVSLAAPCRET